MEIEIARSNHINIVKATGRIDSFTAPRLAEAFRQLLDEHRFNLIFDMTNIDYISSAGLRVMIDVQKTCRQEQKGELVLVGVQKRSYEALELAGFGRLLKCYQTLDQALSNLTPQ
ncbi:MAG: STAS domain-containing protein [candidate division KSB1 bacterium]|nr:STAS domain-containing protein [candidate division KSB1 bacterium]